MWPCALRPWNCRPAREILSASGTLRGGGAAGAATVGAAGVEVLQDGPVSWKPSPRSSRWCPTSTRCAGGADRHRAHRHRRHHPRPARRLETGPAVIGGFLPVARREERWASSSPQQRSCCSLLNLRRAGERAGRAAENSLMQESRRMPSTARCSKPPPVALLIVAVAMAGSDTRAPCPPVVGYTAEDQARAADQVDALPEGSVIVRTSATTLCCATRRGHAGKIRDAARAASDLSPAPCVEMAHCRSRSSLFRYRSIAPTSRGICQAAAAFDRSQPSSQTGHVG